MVSCKTTIFWLVLKPVWIRLFSLLNMCMFLALRSKGKNASKEWKMKTCYFCVGIVWSLRIPFWSLYFCKLKYFDFEEEKTDFESKFVVRICKKWESFRTRKFLIDLCFQCRPSSLCNGFYQNPLMGFWQFCPLVPMQS